MGRIQTAVLVTVVTILIWGFAESESLVRSSTVAARVVFESDDSADLVITPTDAGWSGDVRVAVEAPAGRLGEVLDALRRAVVLRPGMPGVSGEPGMRSLDLREVLRREPRLAGLGVSVVSVEPETLGVRVDRLVTRSVPVRVVAPAEGLSGSPEPSVPQVVLTLPETLLPDLPEDASARVVLDASDLSPLEPGRRQTLTGREVLVPAEIAGEALVRVEPPTVNVSVTPSRRVTSVILDRVPVWVRRPAFQSDRYLVRIAAEDQLISGVRVSGPERSIERIRSGELPVYAFVTLSPDQLEAGSAQVSVSFGELPGLLEFSWEQERFIEVTVESLPEEGLTPAPAGAP